MLVTTKRPIRLESDDMQFTSLPRIRADSSERWVEPDLLDYRIRGNDSGHFPWFRPRDLAANFAAALMVFTCSALASMGGREIRSLDYGLHLFCSRIHGRP